MRSANDNEHLELAVREGRVVFTQDVDFLRLYAAGIAHRGIVYASQQTPVRHVVRGLMLIYDVLNPEEMVNHVEFLSPLGIWPGQGRGPRDMQPIFSRLKGLAKANWAKIG